MTTAINAAAARERDNQTGQQDRELTADELNAVIGGGKGQTAGGGEKDIPYLHI